MLQFIEHIKFYLTFINYFFSLSQIIFLGVKYFLNKKERLTYLVLKYGDKKKMKMVSLNTNALIDLLECDICTEPFGDARLLDCSHTFCLECIQKLPWIIKRYISCPMCRSFTKIPSIGLSGLCCNLYVEKLKLAFSNTAPVADLFKETNKKGLIFSKIFCGKGILIFYMH